MPPQKEVTGTWHSSFCQPGASGPVSARLTQMCERAERMEIAPSPGEREPPPWQTENKERGWTLPPGPSL
jgi:hypothetical protein